jgi:inner membrane protein
MNKREKMAYLFTSIAASQIPDIDVISQFWDKEGLYQMWHRGITHSIYLTPIWALLLYGLCILFFRVKDMRLFFLGWIAVIIHNSSDLFNAWGTGYLEPFSHIRITFGTIPIIDFVLWIIMGTAFFLSRKVKRRRPFYFRVAWMLILFSERPEAKTLYQWAPFVVIVDDGKQLGLYDPRFYHNGQSFLYEYITP